MTFVLRGVESDNTRSRPFFLNFLFGEFEEGGVENEKKKGGRNKVFGFFLGGWVLSGGVFSGKFFKPKGLFEGGF